MKRLSQALLLFPLLLAACGASGSDCARPEVFCVGLVTNTAGLEDYGLNQSAWTGIQQAKADKLIQKADVIESVDTRDYSKNIATFSENHYDLIVTSGAGLQNETIEAAKTNKAISFAGLDQEPTDPLPANIVVMTFPQDQGGFLAGALAAQVTQTSIIGAACETSAIASMWRTCEGFRAGALYINPEITVMVEYRKDSSPSDLFLDEAWGRQAAEEIIAAGADVIFGTGGRTGQGALRAAAEARTWSIGSERDQFYLIPEARPYLLTSVLPDASAAIRQLIQAIRDGQANGEVHGAMDLAPYHDGAGSIAVSAQTKIEAIKEALGNGSLSTGVQAEAPK